jgi:dTDP-4-dehydrorhamnose 3,5-epimerase
MNFSELELPGVVLVRPEPKRDDRGFFARTFDRDEFRRRGLAGEIVQESIAFNEIAGTVRGLHLQLPPHGETKLVRCTRGAIHDVVVDLRTESATFGSAMSVVLDAESRELLVVPPRFAHGYQTLEDGTEVVYAMDAGYVPEAQRGIRFDDPALGVAWPLEVTRVSARDLALPTLAEAGDLVSALGPRPAEAR